MGKQLPGPIYLLFILGISLLALALFVVSVFGNLGPESHKILSGADLVLCILFLIDFFYTLLKSEKPLKYLYTWGWLDLISSIPAIELFRIARSARVIRIIRVLRTIRAVRLLS